jgi:hypothetical protein
MSLCIIFRIKEKNLRDTRIALTERTLILTTIHVGTCSIHFSEEDFADRYKRELMPNEKVVQKLLKSAVPSLHLGKTADDKRATTSKRSSTYARKKKMVAASVSELQAFQKVVGTTSSHGEDPVADTATVPRPRYTRFVKQIGRYRNPVRIRYRNVL